MTRSRLPDQAVRWVSEAIGHGSRVTRVRRLMVGGWHVNHAVDVIDAGGSSHRLVLRRWARPGWEASDPDYTVEREVRVLTLVNVTRVRAPVIVAADPAGVSCDVPALLLTRLPGHAPHPADTAAEGFCRQLADALAEIHDIDPAAALQLDPYHLYYDRAHATPTRWMPATPVWRDAIAAVREPPPPTAMTLIHRDFHPENTLWSRRRLTGVVDWTQAGHGPSGLDLGHMRWNLVADHGQAIADRFLACYRATTDTACGDQPYWDLVSLCDVLLCGDDPGDITRDDLRRFEDYAAAILSRWE